MPRQADGCGAEQDEVVLAALKPHMSRLAGAAERDLIRVPVQRWAEWVRPSDVSGARIESLLEPYADGGIRRSDIRRKARGSDDGDLRGLLILTLAWGMGYANARMLPGIVRLLRHRGLDGALASTAEAARLGEPAEAHRRWVSARLPGLGEPFFTKWFWAASHTERTGLRSGEGLHEGLQRCLILDGRVRLTLRHERHRWSSRTAAGSRLRADRYAAYVSACHDWADRLGGRIQPEDVEWALFRAAGDLALLQVPSAVVR